MAIRLVSAINKLPSHRRTAIDQRKYRTLRLDPRWKDGRLHSRRGIGAIPRRRTSPVESQARRCAQRSRSRKQLSRSALKSARRWEQIDRVFEAARGRQRVHDLLETPTGHQPYASALSTPRAQHAHVIALVPRAQSRLASCFRRMRKGTRCALLPARYSWDRR